MFSPLQPIKPMTLPEIKPIETKSVSKRQSLQEWGMAGGGVPAQYKGREHVWHAKVGKHEVSMKKGGDPLDEFVPPRYRSAGRRPESQNDRKAAANMPVDFARGAVAGALGAPGDLESLVRMIPGLERSQGLSNLVTGEHRETYLPTSEEIEKRLPFRSDTPQGRMASGLGSLAGGFYTGPGSPFNVAGKAAKLAGEGLGTLKGSGSGAKSLAGQRGVVKMPGGNWLTGRVEGEVGHLKTDTIAGETPAQRIPRHEELLKDPSLNQDQIDRVKYQLEETKKEAALDKWVDSNLSNYIKKQMGTPEDPIRALAEQGITHKQGLDPALNYAGLREQREKAGFPGEGMGQSRLAKAWEQAADESIATHRAGDIQGMPEKFTKQEEAKFMLGAARDNLDKKFKKHLDSMNLTENEKSSLIRGMTHKEKANMVGDTDYQQANIEYLLHHDPMTSSYLELGRRNPWISKVDPETPIYAPFVGDLGFDHIMDVLREDLAAGRIRPEQMNKISISDAVRRTHQYDEDMAKKMAAAQIKATEGMPVHKEYPEGYKWIELTQPKVDPKKELPTGYSLRKDEREIVKNTPWHVVDPDGAIVSGDQGLFFANPEDAIANTHKSESYGALSKALKYEGENMGHCVGGYCPDVAQGKSRIFSLRDAKGEPHVTIETQPMRGSELGRYAADLPDGEDVIAMKNPPQRIVQIKGKQNRAPKEEYLPFVQDFVKSGKWSDVGDLENTGLKRYKGNDGMKYVTPEEYKIELKKELGLLPPEEGMAHGGGVHMAGGGLAKILGKGLKAAKQASPLVEAPSIIVPKGVSSIKEAVRQSKGEYGARRVERAADEIPNLEKMYKDQALREAFLGDNAKAVVTMNPADFERYAVPLQSRFTDSNSTRYTTSGERMNYPEYMSEYLPNVGAFNDVPFLEINKKRQGSSDAPFISGHEGRHRNRVMVGRGDEAGLVRLLPRSELREPFPRRSQEEYIKALREELERSGRLVLPEGDGSYSRPAVEFPEPYAKGGEVHMAGGGLLKSGLKKLAQMAGEAPAGVEPILVKAKTEHPLVFPRAAPKTKEDIRPMAQRMAEQMSGEFVRQNPKVTTNPAGKSRKQWSREQEIPLETRSLTEEKEVPFVDYESKKGHILLGVPGDPTLGGVAKRGTLEELAKPTVELTRVGDITPDHPVPLFGGPRYGNDERFWASNYGAAAPIQNSANELAQLFEAPVMGKYIKMAPDSANFALHNLDALLSIQQPERLNKGARNELTKLVKQGSPKYGKFPGFAGFEDPQDVLLQAQMNSKLRKHIAEILTKPTITDKLGLPNGLDVVAAITHPALRNLETGASGFSVGELRHGSDLKQWRGEHPTYDTDIPGMLIGQSRYPIPAEIAFPDTISYARSQLTPGVQEFNMMKMLGPRERIDQQYIDEMRMYEDLMKEYTGKKKGGIVSKQTKSCSCHD